MDESRQDYCQDKQRPVAPKRQCRLKPKNLFKDLSDKKEWKYQRQGGERGRGEQAKKTARYGTPVNIIAEKTGGRAWESNTPPPRAEPRSLAARHNSHTVWSSESWGCWDNSWIDRNVWASSKITARSPAFIGIKFFSVLNTIVRSPGYRDLEITIPHD